MGGEARDDDADVAAAIEELRARAPGATFTHVRGADGATHEYIKCEDTAHVVSWPRGAFGTARARVIDALTEHARGSKFAKAAKARADLAALAEYEPHIVRSKYVANMVFCTVTGTRVRATEEAVVRHASGKKFTLAHAAALRDKAPPKEEKDPEVEAHELAMLKEEQKNREEANKAAKEARERARIEAKMKKREDKKRRRDEGGFDESMGCWVPPKSVIDSDDDDDEDSDDGSDDGDDVDDIDGGDGGEDEGMKDDSGEDFDFDDEDEDEDEDLIPTVVVPGSSKRAKLALAKSKRT